MQRSRIPINLLPAEVDNLWRPHAISQATEIIVAAGGSIVVRTFTLDRCKIET